MSAFTSAVPVLLIKTSSRMLSSSSPTSRSKPYWIFCSLPHLLELSSLSTASELQTRLTTSSLTIIFLAHPFVSSQPEHEECSPILTSFFSLDADRTQREREDSIRAFRSSKTPVLIATGVSARGLDIHKVMQSVYSRKMIQEHLLTMWSVSLTSTFPLLNMVVFKSTLTALVSWLSPFIHNADLRNRSHWSHW